MRYQLLALSLIAISGCEKPPAKPTPPHEVVITQAITCNAPIYRDYVGNVVAKTSVQVMSQATGIMTGQYFVEGQEVKKGDLLLVIDPRPYEATLAKAEGALSQTYASLRFNQEKTSRYSKLVQEDYVSKLDYDQYVTNVISDEAIIKQNQADVETAKIDLGYCYITSPVNWSHRQTHCQTGKLCRCDSKHSFNNCQPNPTHPRGFFCPRKRFEPDSRTAAFGTLKNVRTYRPGPHRNI